jgi:VanZ family protein
VTGLAVSAYWKSLLAWAAVVVWAAFIFALSAVPDLTVASVGAHGGVSVGGVVVTRTSGLPVSASEAVDFVVRKFGHVAAFAVLATLLWLALARSRRRNAPVLAWVLTSAYGATDEFHQLFTAGRHGTLEDVVFDAIGALLAVLAIAASLRLRATIRRRRAVPGY